MLRWSAAEGPGWRNHGCGPVGLAAPVVCCWASVAWSWEGLPLDGAWVGVVCGESGVLPVWAWRNHGCGPVESVPGACGCALTAWGEDSAWDGVPPIWGRVLAICGGGGTGAATVGGWASVRTGRDGVPAVWS